MPAPPRHHTPRNHARPTNGPGVALIAAAKGRPHMPWQRDALDVALELDPVTGHYWYQIVVITVPRQSGKTTVEGDAADHRCLTKRRARVWITMQNGKTVDSWMREEHHADLAAAAVFGSPGTPSCRYTKSLRAGEVGVRWPLLGSSFFTFPPKRDALHSKQSDLVIVDEAWIHDAEAGHDLRQAIRPTMSTRDGAQLWIVSTEGDDSSEYLDHYIEMGKRALGDPTARVCLIDYGIPEDADAEDLEVIAAYHPAIGHTITLESLQAAKDDFDASNNGAGDPAGWARAYGNRRTRTRTTAIPAEVWAAAGEPMPAVPARAGIALDVTPGGHRAAILAGWRGPDAVGEELTAHLEVIYAGPSDRATVDLLVQLARTRRVPLLASKGSYGALEVLDHVARAAPDVTIEYTSAPEDAAACATFDRGIRARTIRHPNDPDLDDAVTVATKVPRGDGGFGWGRKDSAGSIAELWGATLAVRAFDRLPVPVAKPTFVTSKR